MEIHIVGIDVRVGTRVRQRCAWCGVVLEDVDLEAVQVLVEDADKPYPMWPVGALLAVDNVMSYVFEHDPVSEDLPRECCANIDPAVTT